MGKIKFTIGDIVTTASTARKGALFLITDFIEDQGSPMANIKALNSYEYPDYPNEYAEVGKVYWASIEELRSPLKLILKRL